MFQQLCKLLTPLFPHEADPGFTEDLQEVLFEDDGSHYETKRIDGTVTSLRENQLLAIINHDIYMDLAIPVPGGRKLRLNDFVVVVVKRRCEDDAWIVDRVDMIERSKEFQCENPFETSDGFSGHGSDHIQVNVITDGQHLISKTIVGQVTSISNKVIVNNGEIELPLSSANGLTYVVGDWLTLKILHDPEEADQKSICTSAEPLRKWKFEGRINILQEDVGVIDNDIYFQVAVCMNG